MPFGDVGWLIVGMVGVLVYLIVSRRMRNNPKSAVPELKQFGDLSLDDFKRHPVWIGCHGADSDKAWYDHTDEETFRPRTGNLPADPSEGMLLVRATAVLADGCELAGFITPAFDEGDLGTLQPYVFVNGQQFSFWGGMCGFTREQRTSLYERLAKSPEQIFPMRVLADTDLTRGVQVAEVRGFYTRRSGDDIDVQR